MTGLVAPRQFGNQMRKKLKKILLFSGLGLFLFLSWIGYNTSYIWRDYLSGPPVRFRENREITVGLYPRGAPMAAVFTSDDLSAVTPPELVERLRDLLRELEVRGTFFVIPNHLGQYPLAAGSPTVTMMEQLRRDGHEIAQHGWAHYSEKNRGRSVKMGAEMAYLSEEEQYEIIRRGRDLLTGLGFPPRGHRSPCFSGNRRTFRALDRLGFLYGSDLDLPPTTPETLLLPSLSRRLMYPYHPDGLNLLEITSQTDPTVRPKKTLKIFRRYRKRGGVFAFLTHFPQISEPGNLARLERIIKFLREEGVWFCPMAELSEWWLARSEVDFQTGREEETLIIRCDNPSPYPLNDLEITVKDPDLKRFRLITGAGKELRQGEIPPSRSILVDI
jgi:peptidoglycan/xylan/chitin deacetylase (PgdA/CDA1 family)